MTVVKILRAHIFGFGKWLDQTFDFRDASFVCFYGKNEAGKSTLQQFIFYMFFGLPPRKLSFYKPKFSSRIGGTLTVYFPDDGEVTIERVDNDFRLFLPDGKVEENESVLQEKLHHLRKETYEAIYGFSALDLTQLHEIKAAELSDLLFSVGLTGSTSIYEVEKSFERRLDELFKKTGRKPTINQQINKVNEIEKHLINAKKEVLSYKEKVELQREQQFRLEEISKSLQSKREAISVKEKVQQLLPQIRSYLKMKRDLEKFRNVDLTFAEDGLNRYQMLKERLVPLQAENNTLENSIHEYDEAIRNMDEQLLPQEQYERIIQIVAKKPKYKQTKSTLTDLEAEMTERTREIDNDLATLHISEETVESFEAPFYLETEWKQLLDEEKRLQLEIEHLEEERLVLEQKQKSLLEEQKRLEGAFIGFERLKKLKEAISEREKNEKERAALHTLLNWESDRKKLSRMGLIAMTIIMVIIFALAMIQQSSSFGLVGIAITFITIIQLFFYRKTSARIRQLNNQIKSLYDVHIVDQSTDLQEQEELANRLNSLLQSLKDVQIEMLQLDEKQNHLQIKEENWLRKITDERTKYPFLQQVDVSYWLELLREIGFIQEKIKQRNDLIVQVKVLTEEMEHVRQSMQQIGKELGMDDEHVTFETLEKVIKAQQSIIQQLTNYQKLKNNTEERLTLVKEELGLLHEQIAELFSACRVHDEESFYEKARQIEEKQQLDDSYEKLREQLITVFSHEVLREMENEPLDELRIQRDLELLQLEINELETEKTTIQQQLAKLHVEIKQLESSDDYSYTTHVFEKEREKLNQQAEEWAKLKLAYAMLQKAKQRYQEKYLSDVIHYTSQYFTHLTNNRYVAVYQPTEKSSFQVEDERKIRYTVEELSKGTIDQLYVALRFAISKVMSETFVVPLMIDDAFIHFDDDRAIRAIELLKKIATEQQVILYTCRKFIAEAMTGTNCLRIVLELDKVRGNIP